MKQRFPGRDTAYMLLNSSSTCPWFMGISLLSRMLSFFEARSISVAFQSNLACFATAYDSFKTFFVLIHGLGSAKASNFTFVQTSMTIS